MDPKTLVSPEWPIVAAEGGWRGEVMGPPSELEASVAFALDGGPKTTVRFSRPSTTVSHWHWEPGADRRVSKDVLDAAAVRIGVHVAKTSAHTPFDEAVEMPTRRERP
jgi:hypothetical protein